LNDFQISLQNSFLNKIKTKEERFSKPNPLIQAALSLAFFPSSRRPKLAQLQQPTSPAHLP
jgi:hypothetical protein